MIAETVLVAIIVTLLSIYTCAKSSDIEVWNANPMTACKENNLMLSLAFKMIEERKQDEFLADKSQFLDKGK